MTTSLGSETKSVWFAKILFYMVRSPGVLCDEPIVPPIQQLHKEHHDAPGDVLVQNRDSARAVALTKPRPLYTSARGALSHTLHPRSRLAGRNPMKPASLAKPLSRRSVLFGLPSRAAYYCSHSYSALQPPCSWGWAHACGHVAGVRSCACASVRRSATTFCTAISSSRCACRKKARPGHQRMG